MNRKSRGAWNNFRVSWRMKSKGTVPDALRTMLNILHGDSRAGRKLQSITWVNPNFPRSERSISQNEIPRHIETLNRGNWLAEKIARKLYEVEFANQHYQGQAAQEVLERVREGGVHRRKSRQHRSRRRRVGTRKNFARFRHSKKRRMEISKGATRKKKLRRSVAAARKPRTHSRVENRVGRTRTH